MKNLLFLLVWPGLLLMACSKPKDDPAAAGVSVGFTVNGAYNGTLDYADLGPNPEIKLNFSGPIDPATATTGVQLTAASGQAVPLATTLQNANKTLVVSPQQPLTPFSVYTLVVGTGLRGAGGGGLINPLSIRLRTGLDPTDKFPRIADDSLLTLVQRQTFRYFYEFAHPVSGMARERTASGETVTTGGTGMGVMALLVGVQRGFISRAEGLQRVQTIVSFLKNKTDRFHGAFPHWLNGSTGKTVPFSPKDDGADLVETAFLMQGLLAARQYFDAAGEAPLRADITALYEAVEWDWFRQPDRKNVLYWHWSPNYNWDVNLPIRGWNECLVVYVLAAGSPTHPVPKEVYTEGFAGNGSMRNGNMYYNLLLPLGPPQGGPLFFAHYSFLGLNPNRLADAYASYDVQNRQHTLINRAYCVANPKGFLGYGENCWGLTASDDPGGYVAHSPTNDNGTISPTAALGSMPYTPTESMQALKFFYYTLGDKLWGPYGFKDAFNLSRGWFADQYLAIDQGPIVIMMENHRSGLLWNRFMSAPEVKNGLRNLGLTSPYL